MNTKLIAKNPVAYHNYNIEDTFECGIVLTGTEIKSIRAGKVNLKDILETKSFDFERIATSSGWYKEIDEFDINEEEEEADIADEIEEEE